MPLRLVALLLVFVGAVFGQAATGVLTWNTETSATGSYLFPNLAPSTYKLLVEAQGFKRAELADIRVNAGATVTPPVQLELGAVTETTQVSGTALQVETTTGTVSSIVQVEQIRRCRCQVAACSGW